MGSRSPGPSRVKGRLPPGRTQRGKPPTAHVSPHLPAPPKQGPGKSHFCLRAMSRNVMCSVTMRGQSISSLRCIGNWRMSLRACVAGESIPKTFTPVSWCGCEGLITPKGGEESEDATSHGNASSYLPRSAVSRGKVSRKGSSRQPSWTAKTNSDCVGSSLSR